VRAHQAVRRVFGRADEQMCELVRNRPAEQNARVDAGRRRHGLDAVRENRGEAAAALLDVDDRIAERLRIRPGGRHHDPDDQLARARWLVARTAPAPHEINRRTAQNGSRGTDSRPQLARRDAELVIGADDDLVGERSGDQWTGQQRSRDPGDHDGDGPAHPRFPPRVRNDDAREPLSLSARVRSMTRG
jgi:hypothetical protein